MATAGSPRLSVESDGLPAVAEDGRWRMGWYVRNLGTAAVDVVATWLPHGRFRGERQNLEPPAALAPGQRIHLQFAVACSEAADGVVENAFIILQVVSAGAPWRVFARLRIAFDDLARPCSTTELVTAQRSEDAR